MKKIVVQGVVYEYDSINDLQAGEQELVRHAWESALTAYAPYSGFRVGAAVLLDNGNILAGNNQENAAYPSGLCAERVALFYAGSRFPGSAILAMAVAAVNKKGDATDDPVYPCGACRQVLLEAENRFGKKQRLIFAGKNKIHAVNSISDILPLHFDKSSLGPDHR
jgi:cytidine deaminase